jgi:hypothetical protein
VQWINSSTAYSFYIVFDIPAGTYTYYVTNIQAYPQSNIITVTVSQKILIEYNMTTYQVKFIETGLPMGVTWRVSIYSSENIATLSSSYSYIIFYLPAGSYRYFVFGSNNYVPTNQSNTFSISNSNIIINITFIKNTQFIKTSVHTFVPIYIQARNYSIPQGAQIPININWSKYQQYENPNLQNILIVDSNFDPLFSWIETNASSTARNSTVWVKLDRSININQNITLYILFYNSTVNNFDPLGYWGEAPQLSPIFNEYNNIAMVMNQGLLIQVYTNFSAIDLNSLPSPITVINANLSKGSYIYYGGNNYYAVTDPYLSPLQGSQQMIYRDSSSSGNSYVPFSIENNVIIAYQTAYPNYPGTWPSPPIVYTAQPQTWLAKAQGFVFINQSSTSFYAMNDDGTYIQIGSYGKYLNKNWGAGNIIINNYVPNAPTSPVSGTFNNIGIYQISILYGEVDSGQALWQVWTSNPAQYYSPTPVRQLPKISFGPVQHSYFEFIETGLPKNTNWSVYINGMIYTSNTTTIYGYLPYGVYIFSVGTLYNNSFETGYVQDYIPNPQQGYLTVSSLFIIQYIVFKKNEQIRYNIDFGFAIIQKNNISIPAFIYNIENGTLVNISLTKSIANNLSLSYSSASGNLSLSFEVKDIRPGFFTIFITNCNKSLIQNLTSGQAFISAVAPIKLGSFINLAAGIAGTTVFQNSTSTNLNKNQSTFGLTIPSNANISSVQGIISLIAYIGSTQIGRAVYTIVISLALIYYIWRINELKRRKRKK